MAKTPPPPPQHNSQFDPEQASKIQKWTAEIQGLEDDRSAINEDISAIRANIKATGIDMDAWRAAKRRREMDPDDRENFDRSAEICNSALGVPVQADLFADKGDGGTLPSGLH